MTVHAYENVVEIMHPIEDESEHLAREHGLVKTTAYVAIPVIKEEPKQGTAERMARMRKRKKDAGIVSCDLPIAMAQAIKAAGSAEAWLASIQMSPEVHVVEVEKIVEVVKNDTVRLDKARLEISELRQALALERQMLEEIYEMSLLDRILGRWP